MSKLPIPASALIGTPLSMEDLKQIVGGTNIYKCSCTWKSNDYTTKEEFPMEEITSETECIAACSGICANADDCKSVTTHYSSTIS